MSDMKTVGLTFAIGSALAAGFEGNLTRAEKQFKRMGDAVAGLEGQAPVKLGQTFERLQGKLVTSRKALSEAERELEALNAQAERAGGVQGILARKIELTEKRIGALSGDVQRNRRAFRDHLVEVDRQGYSVRSLRTDYARLGEQLDKTRSQYDRYAASMAKSKAYAEQRAEMRAGMMGMVAMGASVASPLMMAAREEDAQIRLEDALNAENKPAAMMEAGKHARDLARTGLVDLTGAYDIQYALNSAGLEASAARAGSTVVAQVAKITNGNAERVGEVIATTFNNLGGALEGSTEERMKRIGDLLTKTQLKFQIRDFGQLGESMTEGAAGLANYNVNLEQGITLLGQLNSAGLGGGRAGTALNAVLRQLGKAKEAWDIDLVRNNKGELDLIATLNQLDAAISDLDPDERAQELQKVFGDEGAKGVVPLLKNLKQLPAALEDVREGSRGIVDARMERHLKAASTQWKAMTNNMVILGSTVGTVLLPGLKMLVGTISSVIAPVADFAARHETLTTVVGGAVIGFMAFRMAVFACRYVSLSFKDSIQMVNRATMSLGMRQQAAAASTNSLTFAQRRAAVSATIMGTAQRGAAMGSTVLAGGIRMVGTAIKAAFVANPVGVVIAGLMLLWELGSALYQSWEPFRNLINWIWEGLGKVGTAMKGMPVIGDIISFFSSDDKKDAPARKPAPPKLDALPDAPDYGSMPGLDAALEAAPAALNANAPVTITISQEFTIANGNADTVRGALDAGKRELESTVERLIDNYFRKQRRVSLA